MTTYCIYHIPGIKIGCSTNPEQRVAKQGYTNFKIIEKHTCIYEASRREQQLQHNHGYQVDRRPYWQVLKLATPKSCSTGGKNNSKENYSRAGKAAGAIKITCDHCGKTCSKSNHTKWHGNNCKNKPL